MLETVLCILGYFIMILTLVCTQSGFLTHLTLNLLSWSTFFMATISWLSMSRAWYTTPKEPFPITLMSVYETSWGRSGPCPGVATTVVTFPLSPKHTTKQVFFFFKQKAFDRNIWLLKRIEIYTTRVSFFHVWPELTLYECCRLLKITSVLNVIKLQKEHPQKQWQTSDNLP